MTEERAADRLRIERATSNAFAGESVTVYHGGLTVEHRRPGDTVSTRMDYDALGRLVSTKQPHHAHADAILYAAGGNQVLSQTDANGAVTSYGYFPQGSTGAGRVASVTRADLTVSRSACRSRRVQAMGSLQQTLEYNIPTQVRPSVARDIRHFATRAPLGSRWSKFLTLRGTHSCPHLNGTLGGGWR